MHTHKTSRNKHASNGNEKDILIFAQQQQQILWTIFSVSPNSCRCYMLDVVVIKHCMCSVYDCDAHVRIISLFFFSVDDKTQSSSSSSFLFCFPLPVFHDHIDYMSFLVPIFKQLYTSFGLRLMCRRYCWWWAPDVCITAVIMLGAKHSRQTSIDFWT